MQHWQTAQLNSLIAALYLENFANFRHFCHLDGEKLLITLDPSRTLKLSVRQPTRATCLLPMVIKDESVILIVEGGEHASRVTLYDMLNVLTSAHWWPESTQAKAINLWHQALQGRTALANLPALSSVSLEQASLSETTFETVMEYRAMQIDRPNHPFAHAKGSLQALLGQSSTEIDWWALPKEHIFTQQITGPAMALLNREQQHDIAVKMRALFAEDATLYLALPALKSERPIISLLPAAVCLNTQTLVQSTTSSLRSFQFTARQHVKFATSQTTLGAKRTMPPRYLHNGDAAYQLLQALVLRSAVVADLLQLCDERAWWSTGSEHNLIACQGEFAVQMRSFPATGLAKLPRFTMAALNHPQSWLWLKAQGFSLPALWMQLLTGFVQLHLTLWQYGVLPECHGQNLQVWLDDSGSWRFILRDHDTLRICPTQLQHQGMEVPDYKINWHTPNTLVLPDLAALLAYFTTLGVQVNLYPIAKALESIGEYHETQFWQQLRECVANVAKTLPTEERTVLESNLLHAQEWPFKAIIAPLLHANESATGMPSALYRIDNPLIAHSKELYA
ncbi:putative siderophore biosynthesis protein [Shewanella denitrificans OS217]|jgi:staphyloferrin B synthase|uniref:Putative siderophore biosynthesis protein n=1 Tax=Shewanella denitrificans (strain OS217 / ATCC BAA-1090 / DSM 15013) TaxID=318161 RepID=Q12RP8_SHEDO|nr:IucA/IucC family C-terminal-domain containing protein [Shewanella denitrificans]ABE53878.1 putative siderophore biosynthesis protein [Shewanella denitrificans OS217]